MLFLSRFLIVCYIRIAIGDQVIKRGALGSYTGDQIIKRGWLGSYAGDQVIKRGWLGSYAGDQVIKRGWLGSYAGDQVIKRGGGWDPINRFNSSDLKPGLKFPTS